jgi:hypothetical protein
MAPRGPAQKSSVRSPYDVCACPAFAIFIVRSLSCDFYRASRSYPIAAILSAALPTHRSSASLLVLKFDAPNPVKHPDPYLANSDDFVCRFRFSVIRLATPPRASFRAPGFVAFATVTGRFRDRKLVVSTA